MDDILRGSSGNITEAMRTISALNKKLSEATAELSHWQLQITSEVISTSHGFAVELSVKKPNNTGFIKTINPSDIAYFANDIITLVDELVEEVFQNLYKEQIRNELTAVVTRSVRNAHMLQIKL